MEEILHHLGYINPENSVINDQSQIVSRISFINSITWIILTTHLLPRKMTARACKKMGLEDDYFPSEMVPFSGVMLIFSWNETTNKKYHHSKKYPP